MANASDQLRVSALYIYPIKSLRGISLQHATLTAQGLIHDRRFMLREIKEDGSRRNMACYHDPLMIRFIPSLAQLDGRAVTTIDSADAVTVSFLPVDGSAERDTTFPLNPDTSYLKQTEIAMHGSPTTGYEMGASYNKWFSDCFGKDVELIFVGHNRRKVFGNLSPNAVPAKSQNSGILQSISSTISSVTGLTSNSEAATENDHEQGLGLSDVAPILLVNETSLRHITRLLPENMEGDMTKFRPNVVISGAVDEFCEDFWRELSVFNSSAAAGGNKILLTQNCNRCVSLNLDYNTGDFATGEAGKVLAKLSKDRRVDPAAKYSPVFGRYGFLHQHAHGRSLGVGDEVVVTGTNTERTAFYWPFKVPS